MINSNKGDDQDIVQNQWKREQERLKREAGIV